MTNHKKSITFPDIEKQDEEVKIYLGKIYQKEISYYQRTSELYISLFSNSKRSFRKTEKADYIQLAAVKLFQDTRAALLLALKGMNPQSASLTRGALESLFLIYDFKIFPGHEDVWFNGEKNKREKLFKVSEIRKRLKEAKVKGIKSATELYNLLSTWSVHINQESHIWYIETTNKSLNYHWAGRADIEKAHAAMIMGPMFSLMQGLFVLTEEGIYTATNKEWLKDYLDWKKDGLVHLKRFAKIFGDRDILKLKMKYPKIIYVPEHK